MSNQTNNQMSNQKEIIVYIYSDYSPCCKQVQPRVVELSEKLQFYILNIDNKRIRRIVMKCKRIKINKVPCLLIINPDVNKVELYEGDNFTQAFDALYNTFIVQPKILEQQMAQQAQQQEIQQQMALQALQAQQAQQNQQVPQGMEYPEQQKSGKRTSPLNLVIDSNGKSTPQQQFTNNEENGIIQQINNDLNNQEQPKAPSKRKLGRNTFINDASLMPFDEEGIVAGNKVERPQRGLGHGEMAQSSLPEIGMTQDYVVSKKDLVANREAISVDTKSPIEPDEESNEMMYDREIALPGNTVKTKMGESNTMNVTSLNGKDISKKVPVKVGKKTEMILDLSEALEDGDSLFTSKEDVNIEEMRGGPPKNDVKTQKMSMAKMAAEQMMKERSAMMEKGGR